MFTNPIEVARFKDRIKSAILHYLAVFIRGNAVAKIFPTCPERGSNPRQLGTLFCYTQRLLRELVCLERSSDN